MKAPAKRRAWAAKRPAKQEVDRFELAMRAINEGIYEWNIADGSTVYSDRVLRSLGLSRRQLRNAADWHQRIHPEDRARFDAALRDHFKGRTERFECDLRYRAGDGGWRWARQHGVAIRDAKGRAVRMIGSTGDITELKRVEEALKASEERYALATRAATEGIYEWNLECDSLYLSDRAKAFFAVAGEALTPAAWNARVHGEDFQGYRDAIVAFFKGRKPVFEHEYRIRDAAGGYAWVRDRAIAVRDPAGRVTRFVGALTDITQRRRAELELRRAHESTTEALARQTATAEILKAIAASPTDVRPVLEALARHAGELCGAAYVNVLLEEESMLRTMAVYSAAGGPPADTAFAMRALPTTVNGRAFVERRPVHVPDIMAVAATEYPDSLEFQRHFGFRTILGVPMLRAGQAIGTISIWRREVRPFSAEEIALIETFAAQAVIAIENVRLFNETKEALEQQTASSEILRVISSSPADLAPVFDAILGGAMQLCEAHLGTLNLYDGEWLHTVAQRGGNPQFAKWLLERGAIKPDGGMVHQAITERRGVQIADAREAPGYREGKPNISKFVDLGAVRTFLAVPLLKDSAVIGIIGIYRPEVRPFSEKQIALVSMFANQAVIAIENARLFNETREALERQTATAEILKVIARSPADVQPVFDAIVTAALKLCAATSANAVTFDGELIHVAAVAEAGASAAEALGRHFGTYPKRPSSDTANTRAILTRQVVAIPDVMEDAEYAAKATAVAAGYRSIVSVPLMRGQNPIGALTVARPEPGHFPERKLALLRTFADQAAIAIENARLFNETKEALEQQTATTNILHVISRSVTDLAPVFEAILENAITLCEGNVAALWQYDGTHLRFAAGKRVSPEATAHYRSHPLALGTYNPTPQAALERRALHVLDVFAERTYRPLIPRETFTSGRHAPTVLAVPLLRENDLLGVVTIWRYEKRLFTDRQVAMVNTFAAQAVIAIENVRLFNETKEALERQTASARILRVIGSSPSDLQPVFDAILENAMHLCDASLATVGLYDGKYYRHVAQRGGSPEYEKFLFSGPFEPKPRYTIGHMIAERQPFHIVDYRLLPDYIEGDPRSIATVELGGTRTYLAVPMLKDGHVVGGITVRRTEVRPFTQKQIDLVRTFADQAVIAIENARLFNETREALERQTATAEILRVISGSPTATQPVFESIVQKCHALYQDSRVALLLIDEGRLNTRASTGYAFEPIPIDRESGIGACVLEGRTIHLPDLEAAAEQYPRLRQLGIKHGYRSGMYAPLMREGRAIGGISVLRRVAGAFSEKDVALLTTFADQAVIAIENVRLFNETKEALEQQTAISEVLRVISSSPADIKPVLEVVASRAAHICDATDARIFVVEGDFMRHASGFGDVPVRTDLVPITRASTSGRAVIDRAPVHVPDIEAESPDEFDHQIARRSGWRSALAVPLMRETRALGAIVLRRREVRPFTEKQAALLATFADQAAIAIENVRLFNETKEALERQTATGEILKVMSASLTDVQPVFDAVALNAARVCGVDDVAILQTEGVNLRRVSHYGNVPVSPHSLVPVPPGSVNERVLSEHRTLHIPDTLAPSFTREFPGSQFPAMGVRALLATPLVRDGIAVGVIHLRRSEARPFTDKQIAMLETFADQAVIAIENVRLFNEIKDSLEQQKASAEVLAAISSSIADTQPVFEKILRSCERLFAGKLVGINLLDPEGLIRIGAYQGPGREELEKLQPFAPGEGSGSGAAILHRRLIQYADAQNGEDTPLATRRGCAAIGVKSVVFAPMIWEERAIGVIFVGRDFAGEFSEKEIALLKTFADQAVIAIQNARLFREIAEKGRQLEEASRHKSQFLASMSHELRTPLNAILGFNEMILGQIYGEVPPDMKEPLEDIQKSGKHLLRLINNVLDLAKIEAGKMELALADYSVQDTVESVRSTLRPLAEAKGLELVVSVPEDIPLAYGDSGRLTQCLMNLAGNSLKFTKQGKVEIAVEAENGHLRWRVADTGIGIPPDKIPTLFSEFKQTDATIASEYGGTGLGLSITRKFVEMHGGRIWVESEPGKGSVFTVEIPLRVTAPA